MKKKRKTEKRPQIPSFTILKLWAMAAGRCEFYGCNEPLWKERLTMKELNKAHIGHIIAYSPRGPRGDRILSVKLAKDFSNLMLVCRDHHVLIDSKEHEKDYPLELLRSYKQKHEDRIKIQTSIQDDLKTTVLLFKANIGDRKVNFPTDKLDRAIMPRYPDGKDVLMDLTAFGGEGNKHYWESLKQHISGEVEKSLRDGVREKKIQHLSVFALGPIPLLMHLGNCIGNLIPVDLYQFHRDTQDWCWKEGEGEKQRFIVTKAKAEKKTKKVGLILSLSGKVHAREIEKALSSKMPFYEIALHQPLPTFLNARKFLLQFQKLYREVLNEIRKSHESVKEIHLFPAVPAPIAVACGRGLLPKIDPAFIVYDCNKQNGGFLPRLRIN